MKDLYLMLGKFLPLLIVLAVVIVSLSMTNWILLHRKRDIGEEGRFSKRIAMMILSCVAVVIILLVLPIDNDTRGQLLGLLGLLMTAVIALSSTTFISNAMAGLMLRAVHSFSSGDFINTGEQFGRVTERGLFHTEIQTEDRDLVTIPNLYLITNPVKVVRSSGTIVSATVSLGYDIPHDQIEDLLRKSAASAELQDPFVQILELGDFSVTYRIAGFLADVKKLLTARSRLRRMMLDTLHKANVEIVSPTFMNQRPLGEGVSIIPPKKASGVVRADSSPDNAPEQLIFDKAEKAEKLEQLRLEHTGLEKELNGLETELKQANEADRASLTLDIERKKNRVVTIEKLIESVEEQKED